MRCAESSVNRSRGSGVARARTQAPSRNSPSSDVEAPASTQTSGARVLSCAASNAASTPAAAKSPTAEPAATKSAASESAARAHGNEDDVAAAPPAHPADHEHDEKKD